MTNVVLAVNAGPTELAGAGEGPAEIAFGTVSLAGPASNVKTITAGGSAQVLANARANRKGWGIQNHDTSETLWVEDNGTPVAFECWGIPPGALWICPPTFVTGNILRWLSAKTGHKFTFRESF